MVVKPRLGGGGRGALAAAALSLLWAGAAPQDPQHVVERRWVSVPPAARREAPGPSGATYTWYRAPSAAPQRIRCQGAEAPRRLRLTGGGLVEDLDQRPQWDGEAWVFEAEHVLGGALWALEAPGCEVEWLRSRPSRRGLRRLAREEGGLSEAWVRRASPLPAALQAWVERAPEGEISARLAVAFPPPGLEEVEETQEGAGWVWRVSGPAYLEVTGEQAGGAPALCLELGARSGCRVARPELSLEALPALAPAPTLPPRGWRLLIPAGPATVRLRGASAGRLRWRRVEESEGLATAVVYPSLEGPGPWEGVAVSGGRGGWLRSHQAAGGSARPWVEIGEGALQAPEALPWVDQEGRGRLWLSSAPGPCAITFSDGTGLFGTPTRASLTLKGAPGQASPPPPQVRGCRAWLETHPPAGIRYDGVAVRQVTVGAAGETLEVQAITGEARLKIQIPASAPSQRVWVDAPGRPPQRLAIQALEPSELSTGEDGRRWGGVISISWVSEGWGPVRVRSDGPIALWAGRRRREEPPVAVEAPTAAAPASRPPPSVEALTRRLAEGSEPARGPALAARGELLLGLGELEAAGRDLSLAAALGEEVASARRALAAARWLRLTGGHRWEPSDPALLPGRAPPPAEVLAAAAAGDWIRVASHPELPARLRWLAWRRAAGAGQIFTPSERVRAYADIGGSSPEVQRLYWGVLAQSRWRPIGQLEGAVRRMLRWPAEPEVDALEGLASLFPETWPQAQTQRTRRRARLELPTGRYPVRLRCLGGRGAAPRGCRFVLKGSDGAQLWERWVDPWGGGVGDELRCERGPCLLRGPPDAWVAQILFLEGGPSSAEPALRPTWVLEAGDVASLQVRGPVVLGLRDRGGTTTGLKWRLHGADVGDKPAWLLPTWRGGRAEISLPRQRTYTVELRADQGLELIASQRVPQAGRVEPSGRGGALAAGGASAWAVPGIPPGSLPPAAQRRRRAIRGRPGAHPPVTWSAGASFGVEPEEDALESGRLLVSHLQLGAFSRPSATPRYLSTRLSLGASLGGEQLGALSGSYERSWRTGPWELRAGASLAGRWSRGPGGGALTGRASGRLWLGRSLSPGLALRLAARASARAPLEEVTDPSLLPPQVWSDYLEAHPTALHLEPRLRWRPLEALALEGRAWITTNPPADPQPLERVGVGALLDLGGSGRWARASLGLEQRPADAHRRHPMWVPSMGLRGATVHWLSGDLGLQLSAGVVWRPAQHDLAISLSARALWGRDRGLRDLAPSTVVMRSWLSDRHDAASNKSYGVDPARWMEGR